MAQRRRVEMETADKQILEGYRAIANGRQVISLRQSLVAGGEDELHRPRLAVARADEPRIEMTRWTSGCVRYNPMVRRDRQGWSTEAWPRSGETSRRFDFLGLLPEVTFKRATQSWIEFEAMAPHVSAPPPPEDARPLPPAGGGELGEGSARRPGPAAARRWRPVRGRGDVGSQRGRARRAQRPVGERHDHPTRHHLFNKMSPSSRSSRAGRSGSTCVVPNRTRTRSRPTASSRPSWSTG